ncbi:MAG: hypothetical protein ACRYG8_05005 [Janthinobacterium lividum]
MKGWNSSAAVAAAAMVVMASSAHAQIVSETPVSASPVVVAPFGYGAVTQIMATKAGQTGSAWCKAVVNRASQCLSVSGGSSCTSPAPTSALVSCNQSGKGQVNESKFAPVDCHGNLNGDGGASGLITNSDWCGWASYMAQRTIDTVYQYNDYVRVGMNRRFGGTVFELYGTDKMDRIQQNPGGAMQLALYGDDLGYAPAGSPSGWFASNPSQSFLLPNATGWDNHPYPTQAACLAAHPGGNVSCRQELAMDNVSDDTTNVGCANDGQDAGAGFNPVQAVSLNCWYGDPNNYVDTTTSPAAGFVAMSKNAPNNYSKSSNVPGLTWTQTTQVVGPFAQLTYDIVGDNTLRKMFQDFQELPAIFPGAGIGDVTYFYKGSNPYNSMSEPVTKMVVAQGSYAVLAFPNRTNYGAGSNETMTEEWASMCDATSTRCITIASFSADAKIIETSNQSANNNSYFGIHGFFTLAPGLKERTTTFIAPYRFDAVVGGLSVRQWIYQLHANQQLPPAIN